VVGRAHTAYLGLVAELGLTLTPSYVAEPGAIVRATPEGVSAGDPPHWFGPGDAENHEKATAEFVALARTVDPGDPWRHPDADALDRLSVGEWLRSVGATPAVVRLWEIGQLSLASGSYERTSLLAALRKNAAVPSDGHYDYEDWEGLRVAEGSATVALRMAEGLGHRVRTGSPVAAVDVRSGPGGCTVRLAGGETFAAGAVVGALPVGPLRSVHVTGVSPERLASLHAQRQACAAKVALAYNRPFWREQGRNGLSECEGVLGSTWPQGEALLSALIPPERYAVVLGMPPHLRMRELISDVARLYGDEARQPLAAHLRLWGTDPWTQGYVTQWVPGDVRRVGPLHGTHEPPFYVCGSDQWVAGYMEGAVRTGRAAAEEALRRG
jgi:monoamine oxidase